MVRNFLYRSYLGEGEKIVFVVHRHILLELGEFLKLGFFGLFLPLVMWWLFPGTKLFAIVWSSIGLARFVYAIFDWYYDVWLVTNASIVEIIWKGFFEKSSTRIEYHIIQGIGYEVKGFKETMLNCGTISLDKFTGTVSSFEGAVNPKRKAEWLTAAQEEFVKNKNFRDHRALQNILSDLLQRHVVEHGVPQEEE